MKLKETVLILLILIVAVYFRFNNLNWDENHHLHPDERFLTMVGGAMSLPKSINEYLNRNTSLLNPENVGYRFFVYGNFPNTLNKILAVKLKKDNYDDYTKLGRQLSAFFDLLTVVFVYKAVKLLIYKNDAEDGLRSNDLPLWAAFFYTIAIIPIQLSHFFAVDTFLNFFMFASFYYALRFYTIGNRFKSRTGFILSSVCFALALASKITAVFILPLNLLFIFSSSLREGKAVKNSDAKKSISRWKQAGFKIILLVLYLISSYFILRIADPYKFQNANILDPLPSKNFIANLQELRTLTRIDPNNFYPPMVQWLNKNTVLHSVINNAIFGLGIPLTILVLIGLLGLILFQFKNFKFPVPFSDWRISNLRDTVIAIWVAGFFVYQSIQSTPTLRYFIIIYPFLAIFAASGVIIILGKLKILRRISVILLIVLILIWPVMFSSVYRNKHTRVEASEWIYKNFKNGSVIANEHWDDGLPLPMVNNYGKQFTTLELPVFGPDDAAKWQQMSETLGKSDYYILSSNRGWGSIPTVPEKFPRMTRFYQDLFAGKTRFKKIAEFTSFPKLKIQISNFNFQISFPDDWADEGFTVYDHPKVMIYEK